MTPPWPVLLDVFAVLDDPRSPHGRRYGLTSFLALVTIALLAGCQNPSQIYAFGQARPGLLARLGFRRPQRVRKKERANRPLTAPNEDTIGNILGLLSPAALNDKFTLFLSRMVGRGANTAAIDGKALRGSDDFVLSVFVNELCQVVWQEDVGEKENELSTLERALPALLERYPGLKLFTGDAAFCHKSIARALPARGDGAGAAALAGRGTAGTCRGRLDAAQANRTGRQSAQSLGPAQTPTLPQDQENGSLGFPGMTPPRIGYGLRSSVHD